MNNAVRPTPFTRHLLGRAGMTLCLGWVHGVGAVDPAPSPKLPPSSAQPSPHTHTWWSLQSPRSTLPTPSPDPDWNRTEVDRFLWRAMEERGLIPAGPADPRTLYRRLSLILTGLPPDAAASMAFETAYQQDPVDAYARAVDRFLASPSFGERFARHWLDVVRFTETHGNEWNYDAAYAWRYRDYIIRAFNEDIPYNVFAREHIAGDVLEHPRWNVAAQFNESPIGTAFYRFGEVNHDSCVQFGIIGYDIVDNQLDTLTKAFQATTVACARCHDHKMDPVSTREYHGLLATLRGSRSVQRTLDAPEVHQPALDTLRDLKRSIRSELISVWHQDLSRISRARLESLLVSPTTRPPSTNDPLHACSVFLPASSNSQRPSWHSWVEWLQSESKLRREFNQTHFTQLADFRQGFPKGWHRDGVGLGPDSEVSSSDLALATEGESIVKSFLPPGLFTFSLSDRMNGALRSPPLQRKHSRISFEVMGGRFSLARLVFNNCQLNYNHQHSIHHDAWSWITLDFPAKTDSLLPYAELLTYWDNPKFPDPLGTLGKDVENQRQPFAVHAANPRTWWGLRRIVLHSNPEAPRDDLGYLHRLAAGSAPQSLEDMARRLSTIGSVALAAFESGKASEDDVRWLQWFLSNGLLENRRHSSPRLSALTQRYRQVEQEDLPQPRVMPGLADEGDAPAQPILGRGDPDKPGDPVATGYVRVLTPSSIPTNTHGSGRRTLAEIITHPANPVTARVEVNRVWQWIFGRGLVGTPDDFGRQGEVPTHPELLDRLAIRFMEEGWSIKRLVRSLILTRAFQSTSVPSRKAREQDPQNLLLSHFSSRRVEAEVIRDSLLTVSGRLETQLHGPSIHPYREKADPEKRLFTGPLDGDGRRSIYLKFQLMEGTHFLKEFNVPGGKVTQGKRDATNVPAQSLAMLNDPFVISMADYWSNRLVADGCTVLNDRIVGMFRTALGREATGEELTRFASAVRSVAATYGVAEADLLTNRAVWRDAAHMMFNLKEFIFVQ